jgi:hypothetical protein
MNDTRVGYLRVALVAVVALAGAIAVPVSAATTWYVATNGSDLFSPCGGKTQPCRSVSKAISLAAAGDTIIVGPGRYGDLDGSGTFGDFPGEEAAEIGSGCECMIKVNKQLTILSRDGALVTVLDAAGLAQSVVHIVATAGNGSVFGKANKGFTIRNGADTGLLTDASSQKVTVQGNVASGNSTGFDVSGPGGSGTGNAMIVADNIAENNDDGFSLNGAFNQMQRNRAVSNSGSGFVIDGNAQTAKQNVAVQNDNGFELRLSTAGGHLSASNGGFSNNAAIGNTAAGVFVDVIAAKSIFMDKSNLYGNGDSANNCGLAVNQLASGSNIGFSGNYWGAATGAGPNPADNGGAAAALCNTGPGSSNFGAVTPPDVAPKELGVAEKPLK